jgi:hypothetical protein
MKMNARPGDPTEQPERVVEQGATKRQPVILFGLLMLAACWMVTFRTLSSAASNA